MKLAIDCSDRTKLLPNEQLKSAYSCLYFPRFSGLNLHFYLWKMTSGECIGSTAAAGVRATLTETAYAVFFRPKNSPSGLYV